MMRASILARYWDLSDFCSKSSRINEVSYIAIINK